MTEKKQVNINSNDFEMIIEESQSFFSKGLDIVVFVNKNTNKRLYAKAVKMAKEGIILQPLTTEEMKEFSIQESLTETSYNSDGTFEMDIQESVSDSEPVVKPIAKFNSSDPESMRKAAKLATEIADKLENQNPENSGIQAAKEVLKDMQENLSVELTALGVDTNPQDLKTKTDIDRAVSTVHKMRELKEELKTKTTHQIPSGTVPLSSQTPAQTQNQGFGSYSEMVADLRQRSIHDPIAREALNQLMLKSLKGARETTLPSYQEEPKQFITTDLIENGRLTAKPDVCGIQHSYREKRLRAMAEKGDASALAILNSGDF